MPCQRVYQNRTDDKHPKQFVEGLQQVLGTPVKHQLIDFV